jgi:hypothetical protein
LSKPAKLPGSRKLLRRSLAEFRAHWKIYLGIVALVSVPVNIIETYFAPGAGLQSYLSMAGLFMNVALLYAVVRIADRGQDFGVRTAFYSGSHAILRLFVVLIWIGLMIVPLAVGSEIYAVGMAGPVSASLGENILLGLLGLIFALPSLWLLGRFSLSLVAVVDHEIRPISALRLSWRLTAGRFWPVLGRLIMLVIWSILIMILPLGILALLYGVMHWVLWLMLLQLVAALIGLPLYSIYVFNLYEALGGGEAFSKGAAK